MRPVRILLFNLALIFMGGALLAPLLYWLAQACVNVFPELAAKPFHRYVSRSLMLVALFRLWPLFRDLGARNLRDIGLAEPRQHWRRLLQGLSVGITSFAVVVISAVTAGGRTLNDDLTLGSFASHLPKIVPTMIVVAVLEEMLFRGAIFGVLQRSCHWLAALAVSSLFYAFVHFLARVEHTGPVTLWSGLNVVGGMFHGFIDPRALLPEFLNLTMVGGILAWGYRRTGNLYFSIGLHAGWVFWVKTYGLLTVPAVSEASAIWGSRKLVDGWIIFLAMVIAALLMPLLPREPRKAQPEAAD